MAERACDQCGRQYEAKRPNSRFCGDTCRKRSQRDRRAAKSAEARKSSGLADQVRSDLKKADRLNTVLGRQAIALAGALETAGVSGASVASLSRELSRVMAEAMQGARLVSDALDEFTLRLQQKAASA